MRPGMIRQPLQSRTVVDGRGPIPLPASCLTASPTAAIRPSRTTTSARSTRHAPSCNSTSPPARIRSGGADGTARVVGGGGGGGGGRTSGRNARLHAGRVVREVEVDAQFFHQVIVRVHTGEDALGSARIDQQ